MFRIVLITAAAVAGGVALGRRLLDRGIEKHVSAEIEAAQAATVAELERRAGAVIRERLARFAIALAVKAALIGGVVGLHLYGPLSASDLRLAGVGLIAVFVLHDLYRLAPQIPPAWRLARASGWSPRRALRDIVAAAVFERVHARTLAATAKGPGRLALSLSNHTPRSISEGVAEAVAEIAAATSYERIRLRVILAAATAGTMMLAYAGFVALTLGSA